MTESTYMEAYIKEGKFTPAYAGLLNFCGTHVVEVPILKADLQTICEAGLMIGREIQKHKGAEAKEGCEYLVQCASLLPDNLYEAFREGVNRGVQERLSLNNLENVERG